MKKTAIKAVVTIIIGVSLTALGYGTVVLLSKGKADMNIVNKLLAEKLN
jgi:hypothetical protein